MILRHFLDAGVLDFGPHGHSTQTASLRHGCFTFSTVTAVVLAVTAAGIPTVRAAEKRVSWLAEVQTPPATAPETPLAPLWTGTDVLTQEIWSARRTVLRNLWLDTLGPMPPRPESTAVRVLRTDDLPDVTRELIEYESEPGLQVQAYLLRPKGPAAARSRAGIVALHPTTTETIEPIAGVVGEPVRQLGLKLAQRGFVVICPRCFLWQDVTNYQDAVNRFRQRHPRTKGMHKMLYDAQRALDILLAQPDVDPSRIGAIGHSLGAKEALYLTALDDRVQAAVASEGGLGLTSTNWDAPWYLGPEIREPGFARNHHELIALIAPRPFLVIAGEEGNGAADGDRSWPYLQAARPVYALETSPPALGILNHRSGHSLPADLIPRVFEWLEVSLAR